MEPTFKSASWTPIYYGQDQSFAKGIADVIFCVPGNREDYSICYSDEATAIRTIISSISHPEYGEINGVFNDGLDLHIVRSDGTVLVVNGEENPGQIHDSSDMLSGDPFILELRNPVATGVTPIQYRELFVQESRRLMRDFEDRRIRKALKLTQAEQ